MIGAGILSSPLFRKYAGFFLAVVAVALCISGGMEIWFSYRENLSFQKRALFAQGQNAAIRISQFVTLIESQLGWTTQLPWTGASIEERRFDALRLLRQAPAITELVQIDSQGREQLRVSRLAMDVIGSQADLSKEPFFTETVARKSYYSPIYFRRDSEPYMTIAAAGARRDAGVSVAEVNLKFIWDVVAQIRVGQSGYAYVVDGNGRLIAHPDISRVLQNTDFSGVEQVKTALSGNASVMNDALPRDLDLGGQTVIASAVRIPALDWYVFVELPLTEALKPIQQSALRSALVLALGLALAALAALFLARRMAVPIRQLQASVERIGNGTLDETIRLKTGDEIEALAGQFNTMAARLKESYANLEAKVETRTRDLSAALEQQTATAEVLKTISRSAFDVGAVFDELLSSAARLGRAESAALFLIVDGKMILQASTNGGFFPNGHEQFGRQDLTRGMTPARAVLEKRVIHLADVLADPEFTMHDFQRTRGFRATLAVPLLRDGQAIGSLNVNRTTPGLFSQREVELVETFADQAVIAIENTRLFEQVQQRTRELAQSLDDLRAAQDRLVQTEKLASLGHLTAGIAHEIKNPLNFVNNFAQLSATLAEEIAEAAAKGDASEAAELSQMLKDNLTKIAHHGARADSIVKNMLMHSRAGSGEWREVEINHLADEALNLAYHGARAERPGFNVELVRRLAPEAGMAKILPQEISRVLINLISNAFYATEKRRKDWAEPDYKPRVTLITRRVSGGIKIKVRDNGTGIAPDVRAKLFTPFFTTKPTGEGTGLGLSISHDIVVKQHGGRLSVNSEPGHFTEFTLVLPVSAPVR